MNEQLNLFDVKSEIADEGIHTCFRTNHWEEVRDAKFHQLRHAYLDAAEALEEYIELNSQDPLEEWF